MRARIGLRHFDQNLRQPIGRVDHHVVAGSGRLEGAPRLVGLALCERLVEGRLRILWRADIGLLRHLLARAGEPDRLQRHTVWLRGKFRIDPGAILLVDMERLRLGRRTARLALFNRRPQGLWAEVGGKIESTLAVFRLESVEPHNRGNAIERLLDGARAWPATIGMDDQTNVVEG